MHHQLTYADLVHSGLHKEIVTELSRFSVGFVKLIVRHGKEDMILAGPGTLVQGHNRFGILTADHVLQPLPDTQVGVILPSLGGPGAPHRILIDMGNAEKLQIGPATYKASGHWYTHASLGRRGEDRNLERILQYFKEV